MLPTRDLHQQRPRIRVSVLEMTGRSFIAIPEVQHMRMTSGQPAGAVAQHPRAAPLQELGKAWIAQWRRGFGPVRGHPLGRRAVACEHVRPAPREHSVWVQSPL